MAYSSLNVLLIVLLFGRYLSRKNFAFLSLEPLLNIKYGFNWAGKNEHFSKVSLWFNYLSVLRELMTDKILGIIICMPRVISNDI